MKSVRIEISDRHAFEHLRAGDEVLLSGRMITARDAAHRELIRMSHLGQTLPVSLKEACVFYAGPTPVHQHTGRFAIGPTTSKRMDIYTEFMLQEGVAAFIGKGKRSEEVRALLVQHKAVYFVAIGGIAALLSEHIITMEAIAFGHLGPEAIYALQVKDFPCYVGIDLRGNCIYESSGGDNL